MKFEFLLVLLFSWPTLLMTSSNFFLFRLKVLELPFKQTEVLLTFSITHRTSFHLICKADLSSILKPVMFTFMLTSLLSSSSLSLLAHCSLFWHVTATCRSVAGLWITSPVHLCMFIFVRICKITKRCTLTYRIHGATRGLKLHRVPLNTLYCEPKEQQT